MASTHELIEDNRGLVWHVIHGYFRHLLPKWEEDLYSEGCLMLCLAARTYDPTIARWSTFACKSIWGGLLNFCRKCIGPLEDESRYSMYYPGRELGWNGVGEWSNERPMADNDHARPVPAPREWECVPRGAARAAGGMKKTPPWVL